MKAQEEMGLQRLATVILLECRGESVSQDRRAPHCPTRLNIGCRGKHLSEQRLRHAEALLRLAARAYFSYFCLLSAGPYLYSLRRRRCRRLNQYTPLQFAGKPPGKISSRFARLSVGYANFNNPVPKFALVGEPIRAPTAPVPD